MVSRPFWGCVGCGCLTVAGLGVLAALAIVALAFSFSRPGPLTGRCPQALPESPEALGRATCPQQVSGVEVNDAYTFRPGGSRTPTGTFRAGEDQSVGVYFDLTLRDYFGQLDGLVVQIRPQGSVVPVSRREPAVKGGGGSQRTKKLARYTGNFPQGLYGFQLVEPGSDRVPLRILFRFE